AELVARLKAQLDAAQTTADQAAQARALLQPPLSAAQAAAASADADVDSVQGQIDDLEAQIDQLLAASAGGDDNRLTSRLPVDGGGGGPSPIVLRRIHELEEQIAALEGPLATAQAKADAAAQALAAVTAQAAAADAAVQAAQAAVAGITSQLAQAQAAE